MISNTPKAYNSALEANTQEHDIEKPYDNWEINFIYPSNPSWNRTLKMSNRYNKNLCPNSAEISQALLDFAAISSQIKYFSVFDSHEQQLIILASYPYFKIQKDFLLRPFELNKKLVVFGSERSSYIALWYATISIHDLKDEDHEENQSPGNRSKKSVGRTLETVTEAVELWRKLERGVFARETGTMFKFDFEKAASKIGIKKRSLDDYQYIINKGEEFGFDFEGNYFESVGTLRLFIKDHDSKSEDERIPKSKTKKISSASKKIKKLNN